MDEEEGFLTCDKLTPIAIETVESGIAIHAGGQDKSGNYVIFFPPKKHAMIATQFAFGSHLVQLIQYFIGITTYTGVYRKRFTFYADLRDMNYGAAESIVKSLTTVYNKTSDVESGRMVDSLLVVKPKDKKLLKALHKIVGINSASSSSSSSKLKSDPDSPHSAPNPKPPYPVHILNDIKELHRKIDVSQLPLSGGGYMPYSHSHFVEFIKKFENTRRAVDSGMEFIDELLGELERLTLEDASKLSESERKKREERRNRITAGFKEIEMNEMSEKLKEYKASLLDRRGGGQHDPHSQIPTNILIDLALTVCRDCLDEIKKRKDRYKLLDRQHSLILSPLYKLSTNSSSTDNSSLSKPNDNRDESIKQETPRRNSKQESQLGVNHKLSRSQSELVNRSLEESENGAPHRTDSFNGNQNSKAPRLLQSRSMSYTALKSSQYKSTENIITAEIEAFDESDAESPDAYSNQSQPVTGSPQRLPIQDLASRRQRNSLFIPISQSRAISSSQNLLEVPGKSNRNQARAGPRGPSTPGESLSRFRRRERDRQIQKSVPNLNELGDYMEGDDNGGDNKQFVDSRILRNRGLSNPALDDVTSPGSNVSSLQSGEALIEPENQYDLLLNSPIRSKWSLPARLRWDNTNVLPQFGPDAQIDDIPPGASMVVPHFAAGMGNGVPPHRRSSLQGLFPTGSFSQSEGLSQDQMREGYELLAWFRSTGLNCLEQNQVVPECAPEAETELDFFEAQVVPQCLDKIDQAEQWLQSTRSAALSSPVGSATGSHKGVLMSPPVRLWDEVQSEVNSFRKAVQRLRHQHHSVNNFFKHVRKALQWYKMIMVDMPDRLLDSKGRPNAHALNHYITLSEQQHDQMKAIKQKYPHLSPAISSGVNKHMIYITDFMIRMEARQLVQTCVLVDKLINIYSLDPNDAIKAIYQNRRGPNSLPTPENSSNSFHFEDGDSSLFELDETRASPQNPGSSVPGDSNFRYHGYQHLSNRGRTGLPDKKNRINRSLPSFSPNFASGGSANMGPANGLGFASGGSNSPARSISPTYSNRSYLSTSSTASSSNNAPITARISSTNPNTSPGQASSVINNSSGPTVGSMTMPQLNYIPQRSRHYHHTRPKVTTASTGSVSAKISSNSSKTTRGLTTSGSMTNLRSHAPMDAIHEHP